MSDTNITSTNYFLLCIIGSGLLIILLAGTIYSLCLRIFRREKGKGKTEVTNLKIKQTEKEKVNAGIGNSNKPQVYTKPKRTLSLKSITNRRGSMAKRPPNGSGFYTAPSVVDSHPVGTMDPMGFDQIFSSADWMSGYLYGLQFQHVAVIMEEGQGIKDMDFSTKIIDDEPTTQQSSSSTSGNMKIVTMGNGNMLGEPQWILTSPSSPASFIQLVKPYPIPIFGMMQCSSSMSEVQHEDSNHYDVAASVGQTDYSDTDHAMDMSMDFSDGGAAAAF